MAEPSLLRTNCTGRSAARSRAMFKMMLVDVSVSKQNLLTTSSKCGTSCTAISRIQLSSPVTLNALISSGALLMLFLRLRGEKAPPFRKIDSAPWFWRNALIIGTLMLAGGMGGVAVASQTIGSGLIATFIAVVPLMVALIGLAFGKRPSKLEIVGKLIGFGGVIFLVQGKSFGASTAGLLAMFGATLTWSIGSVLQTTRLPLAPGPMGFASEMLCGGAVLLLISLALGEKVVLPLDARALLAWGYLVVFGSLIAFSAYLFLLANISPALATSYAFVNPVIALFLGVWLGAEVVQKNEWLACGVILFGVLMFFAARLKTPSQDAPKK